jgi:1-acyl-sn-glycerol-3-phosphate acyltransferase
VPTTTLFWRTVKRVEDAITETLSDLEVESKIGRLPLRLNSLGYDPWGLSPQVAAPFYSVGAWLYRNWFRCEVEGIERVPEGRVLIIANHGGQIAWDGLLLATALLLDRNPPRLVRAMGERFIGNAPVVSWLIPRIGHVLGDPENCRRLLEAGEAIMVFPEGVRGISKPIFERYQLREFGSGFVRLAVATGTPVVPVGIVGTEEATPGVNAPRIARALGLPSFPVTPFFPWLGPLGLAPLPTKVRILFDEPVILDGAPDEPEEAAYKKAEHVRAKVQALLRLGVSKRRGLFS